MGMFSLSEVAHTVDRACRNVKGALYFRGFFVYSPRSVPDNSLVVRYKSRSFTATYYTRSYIEENCLRQCKLTSRRCADLV